MKNCPKCGYDMGGEVGHDADDSEEYEGEDGEGPQDEPSPPPSKMSFADHLRKRRGM